MQAPDINKIFTDSRTGFDALALDVFRFQYAHNPLYRQYCDLVHKTPADAGTIEQVAYLPISFFKTHKVQTTSFEAEAVFESSGTTGTHTSRHYVKQLGLYEASYRRTFEQFYGHPSQYCFLALLPSYLERSHSSLVHMVKGLMEASAHPLNGFFLNNTGELHERILRLMEKGEKVFLIGVTYALLDFAEAFPMALENVIVMETGGMKGRRKEMIRLEVHNRLQDAFHLEQIHSEYGMTELLSQAYAKNSGMFETPSWMKMLVSDEDDPGGVRAMVAGTTAGTINMIDLANLYSCSFIATEDIGRLHPGGSFEVLGRRDNTDIRGCSLLAP